MAQNQTQDIDMRTNKIIGTATGAVNIGDTTSALKPSTMTTAERDALTPVTGMVITNSDVGEIQFYNGSGWQQIHHHYFHGMSGETINVDIAESGGVVTLSLDVTTGTDLTFFFTAGVIVVDVSTPLTIALTAGSDTVPQMNYVYVLATDPTTLVKNTTPAWPTVEHSRIGKFWVQSAASVATDKIMMHQNTTQHMEDDNQRGHAAMTNERLRDLPAEWESGIAPTFSGSGTATVGLSTTAGIVKQLHPQVVPLFADPVNIYVVNEPGTSLNKITNLHTEITQDSTGSSIGNNKWFALVFYVVASKTDSGASKILCNLPGGTYNNAESARVDVNRFNNYGIDPNTEGKGALIHLLIIKKGAASSLIDATESRDLRGQTPGTAVAGVGAAGSPSFADSTFMVFDDMDSTKIGNFQISGVTTGNTRTLTWPDVNGEIAINLQNVVNTLHKFDGTTAPTANEDSNDGYSVGSVWVDVTNDKAYTCLDASVGAAVWTETTQAGGDSGEGHITILPHDYNAVGAGTWRYGGEQTGAWGQNLWGQASAADGQNLTYEAFFAAGTYTCRMLGRTQTNLGISDIDVGGVEVASFDWYSGSAIDNVEKTQTGITIATAGIKDVLIQLDGKHGSSSNFFLLYQSISFWRTA